MTRNAEIAFLFQPTRPLRGATNPIGGAQGDHRISTHAPLAGRDPRCRWPPRASHYFNPRAPCGARLQRYRATAPKDKDFNPRAPCGARLAHPPCTYLTVTGFQPTRPLRGATARTAQSMRQVTAFQPTRPLRGATRSQFVYSFTNRYFNPRAPCGARPQSWCYVEAMKDISTHAPLAGRDDPAKSRFLRIVKFQPTRPLRGATMRRTTRIRRGSRFQPTRPLRGATAKNPNGELIYWISTHAPLAGRDLFANAINNVKAVISTHAPLAGRDPRLHRL